MASEVTADEMIAESLMRYEAIRSLSGQQLFVFNAAHSYL